MTLVADIMAGVPHMEVVMDTAIKLPALSGGLRVQVAEQAMSIQLSFVSNAGCRLLHMPASNVMPSFNREQNSVANVGLLKPRYGN